MNIGCHSKARSVVRMFAEARGASNLVESAHIFCIAANRM